MVLVGQVILWYLAVVGTIYSYGDGDSFKGKNIITIDHSFHVRLGINVNIGEELVHEQNTTGDSAEFSLEGINVLRICITRAVALHLHIPRVKIRSQMFGR